MHNHVRRSQGRRTLVYIGGSDEVLMPYSAGRVLSLAALLWACGDSDALQNNPPTPGGTEPQADLAADPIETPQSIRTDSILEMWVGVRNAGARTAGPGWMVRVFLSSDAVIEPSSDRQIDQFVTSRDLPPGSADRYLRNKKLDRALAGGTYYIGSLLDATGVVPETDEANNILRSPGTITLLPEPVSGGS